MAQTLDRSGLRFPERGRGAPRRSGADSTGSRAERVVTFRDGRTSGSLRGPYASGTGHRPADGVGTWVPEVMGTDTALSRHQRPGSASTTAMACPVSWNSISGQPYARAPSISARGVVPCPLVSHADGEIGGVGRRRAARHVRRSVAAD